MQSGPSPTPFTHSHLMTLCRAGDDELGAWQAAKVLHRGTFLGDEPDLGMNPTG